MRLTSQQLRQFAKARYLFLPECPRLVWAGKGYPRRAEPEAVDRS
jgi:hypothetical protein